MTATLPAAELDLIVNSYLRERSILSGEGAADEVYGWRGINNQSNYVYAIRTHVVACVGNANPESAEYYSTTNTSLQTVTRTGRFESGADVVKWYLAADIHRGSIKLVTSRGSTAELSVTDPRARVYGAVTSWSSSAKGEVTWYLQFKAQTSYTGKIYRATVCELRLVAADIP